MRIIRRLFLQLIFQRALDIVMKVTWLPGIRNRY
jgi:hypothetical protein